jgi:hypothetical protein
LVEKVDEVRAFYRRHEEVRQETTTRDNARPEIVRQKSGRAAMFRT